jgi:TolA-binding protein
MKVVDIHPEELIDKLHTGELTSAEHERLDAHLAQCSSCRFEISVRADLEREAPLFEERPQLTFAGQAAPRTLPLAAEVKPSAPRAPASVRPRVRRRWRLVMLAAALVLCAGGATAAVVSGAVVAPNWLPWSPAPKAADKAVNASDAKTAHMPKRTAKPVATSAASPVPSVTASAVEAIEPVAPVALPTEPASAPSVAARAASLPSLAPVREAAHAATAAVSDPEPSSAAFPSVPEGATEPAQPGAAAPHLDPAASLFADANRARRDGNVDRAVALYQSLQARYPSSSESQLSRALLAQLLLDRGNPSQALAGFDRYLAGDAPVLSAEALVGRARALEQLGRTEQAASAWQQVQSRFPGSVHARLAATRLAALGMR